MGDDGQNDLTSIVESGTAKPESSPVQSSNSGNTTEADKGFTEDVPDPVETDSEWFWPGDIVGKSEEVIQAINPHPVRSIVPYAAGAAFLVIALYFSILEVRGREDVFVNNLIPLIEVGAPKWFWLLPATVFLLGGGIIAAEYIRRRLTWLIVTDQNLYIRRNILFRAVSDFEDDDINKISQDDPWPLKRLGIGHIKIYTASTDEWEARMMYVPNPSEVRSSIRKELEPDE